MKIDVVCFGALRSYLPEDAADNRAALELQADARVRDVLQMLGVPDRLVFALLVDGERAAADRELLDGAEVTLMPPFSGGA